MIAYLPDARGRFRPYGGQYGPETLADAIVEVETGFAEAQVDRYG